MKKLLTICAVATFILAAAGQASAMGTISTAPDWAGSDRTVHAEWDNWIGYPNSMSPDNLVINPDELTSSPLAYAGQTAVLWSSFKGRSNVIELNEDEDLLFNIPNFAGGDYKEVWVQVTYCPSPCQSPVFNVYTEEPSWDMTVPVSEVATIPDANGWVTEAWSFQIRPNPDWEAITLSFTAPMIINNYSTQAIGGVPIYLMYVDQVVIDTRCVPEPTTIFLLGLGTLALLKKRRQT